MAVPLRCGIPSLTEYSQVLDSAVFAEIQTFSEGFLLEDHRRATFSRRWPADPLHTYNRQWEYPFAALHLAAWQQQSSRGATLHERAPRALDFGSGYTFFPWYLAQLGWSVTCYDTDDRLRRRFAAREGIAPVALMIGDGRTLPYSDGYFDAVYSVSVLEHVPARAGVLSELIRVLSPGGLLILTFDVGLQPQVPISVPEAQALLADVGIALGNPEAVDIAVNDVRSAATNASGWVTSRWARSEAPQLLPWRLTLRGVLGSLARLHWPRPPFSDLTFCCIAASRLV